MENLAPLSESERWIMSFYRVSEINGALFFGRLAKTMKDKRIQHDLTKHFADESQHAWLWTKCLSDVKAEPIDIMGSYQDQYLATIGLPTNMMEVLSITQVFERRVIGQYGIHRQIKGLNPYIAQTLDIIMEDEKWHIQWITAALKRMEGTYSKEEMAQTMQRYQLADQSVYEKTLEEHGEHLQAILGKAKLPVW